MGKFCFINSEAAKIILSKLLKKTQKIKIDKFNCYFSKREIITNKAKKPHEY